MTTPRTIPENPKLGERYAVEKSKDVWQVSDYGAYFFDDFFSEADARLLVEGQATIDRLTAELAELKKGEPTDSQLMAAAVDAQRRADNYAKKLGELSTELAELRAACEEAASAAGRDWLQQQLKLAALLARTPEEGQ